MWLEKLWFLIIIKPKLANICLFRCTGYFDWKVEVYEWLSGVGEEEEG